MQSQTWKGALFFVCIHRRYETPDSRPLKSPQLPFPLWAAPRPVNASAFSEMLRATKETFDQSLNVFFR